MSPTSASSALSILPDKKTLAWNIGTFTSESRTTIQNSPGLISYTGLSNYCESSAIEIECVASPVLCAGDTIISTCTFPKIICLEFLGV